MDKISVIIPVYNSEKYLNKCIDSLINQTYKNMEIIVVNDGSTDNSKMILDEYVKKYPEIVKVHHWSNHGIGATRNKGLTLATGDYIGFVDSDDYVEDNMYEELINIIKKDNSDAAICNIRKYNENGTCGEIITGGEKDTFTLLDNPKMVNLVDFGPCNKLFKRSLLEGLEFSVKYKYEDLIPVFMALVRASKISKTEKLLYNYYINDNGETRTINERNIDMYYIIKQLLEECNKYKNNKLFWLELEKFCVYRIYEIYGNMIDTKYNCLLKDFMNNSIDLLKKYFGDYSKSIKQSYIKRRLLMSKLFCQLYINIKGRRYNE